MNKALLWLALPLLLPACGDSVRFPTEDGATDTDPAPSTGGTDDGPSADTEPSMPTPDPDDSSSGGEESSGSGGASCDPQTHACVPAATGLWNGPFARSVENAGCSGAYPDLSRRTHQGVYAPPAECACECGAASSGSCEHNATVLEYVISPSNNENGCENATDTYPGVDELLTPVGPHARNVRYIIDRPEVDGPGVCGPVVIEDSVPPLQEILPVQTCAPADELESCDESTVCAPIPGDGFTTAMCVWADGDAACPSGYPEKTLTHTDVEDTRACEPCACGPAEGETCSDAEGFAWFSIGGGPPEGFAANGGCRTVELPGETSIVAVSFDAGVPRGGTCDPMGSNPTGGEPIGRAEFAEDVTVCCQAELPE